MAPESIAFYFDPAARGACPYLTVTPTELPTWPFSTGKMFMILNLAEGGDGGATVPGSFTTATMLVDYVRVTTVT